MKNKFSLLLLSCLLLFSCMKNSETINKAKPVTVSLADQPPSLDEVQQQLTPFTLPFEKAAFSLAPDDQYDEKSIVKYNYTSYPGIESYFARNNVTGGYSQVMYNRITGNRLKLQITIEQLGDSVQKWSLQDSAGVPYTQISVNTITARVYENIEGTDPVLTPLGPIDTIQNQFACGHRTITECAKCVGEVCDEHWQCHLLCELATKPVCYASHVAVCLLHKAKGDYGYGAASEIPCDPRYPEKCRFKILKDSLHLLTDSLHF